MRHFHGGFGLATDLGEDALRHDWPMASTRSADNSRDRVEPGNPGTGALQILHRLRHVGGQAVLDRLHEIDAQRGGLEPLLGIHAQRRLVHSGDGSLLARRHGVHRRTLELFRGKLAWASVAYCPKIPYQVPCSAALLRISHRISGVKRSAPNTLDRVARSMPGAFLGLQKSAIGRRQASDILVRTQRRELPGTSSNPAMVLCNSRWLPARESTWPVTACAFPRGHRAPCWRRSCRRSGPEMRDVEAGQHIGQLDPAPFQLPRAAPAVHWRNWRPCCR
jgi:hypothetical protein